MNNRLNAVKKSLLFFAAAIGMGFALTPPTQAQLGVYEYYYDSYWLDGGGTHTIDLYVWEHGMDVWIDGEFDQQLFDPTADYEAMIEFYSFFDQIDVNIYGYSTQNIKVIFYGSDFADTIYNHSNIYMIAGGGDGDDEIHGGSGPDKIMGDEGDDTITGGEGDDELYGNDGDDDIWGGPGNDFMRGVDGNDEMWGGTGDDNMRGGLDEDMLDGGEGNDTLIGYHSYSVFHQLPDFSVDTLIGGPGQDDFRGGIAYLYFFYQGYAYPIEIEFMPDHDPTEDTIHPYFFYLFTN